MAQRTAVTTEDAPNTDNPYSQGILLDGFLFVSGFGPVDPETMADVDGDIEDQTDRVIANLSAVLAEGGGSLEDVVKVTVYLDDMDDYDAVNEAYANHFGDEPPARVCLEAARLPGDVSVEIDAIAKVE
ncbi:dfrA [Halostagnicola sp. A56]|uniref:Rid family detoxifying hydrolase n=1 Tax=Halostagnicola sp. A56 TaxID=1495067 RepID=UPI00049EABE9|nr:Rid family detoxifying hydrolase [Halostagnicola sp. A56]KDE59282.1 dfrA [Halostagnicola sp. A56]